MILSIHMLFGAAISHLTQNIFLAIILAYFSHYFLDFIPHIDYSISIGKKHRLKTISKITLDFFSGIALIYIFSNNMPIIYLCAFVAIIPDGLTVLNKMWHKKILDMHTEIHCEKIHFLKHKKIPVFWRFFTQITIVLLSILLFKV